MSSYFRWTRSVGHVLRNFGPKRRMSIYLQNPTRISCRRFSDKTEINLRRPSNFEKRILVFSKFYPSVDAVPEEVSFAKMTKAKDLFRMKMSIGMMIVTVAISMVMIYLGRRAAKSGQNLFKENIDQFQERHKTSMSAQQEK